MNKSSDSPIIYDFFSKSLKDIAYSRRNQADDHNFKGIPAEIVGVSDYEEYQCVDVKFLINDVYIERDNMVLESMTLKRVFVALQRSGGFSIKQPVAVGDIVRLSWAHRDLGDFLDGSGSSVDLSVKEIARIEDCWVELGFGTRKNHTNPSVTDFIIEGPNTKITITPENGYSIVNKDTILNVDSNGNVSLVTNGTSSITSSAHTINTDTTINGNLTVNGTTDVTGVLTTSGQVVTSHTHNGTTPPLS